MSALPMPATMGMMIFKLKVAGCWLVVAGRRLEEEHEFARIDTNLHEGEKRVEPRINTDKENQCGLLPRVSAG